METVYYLAKVRGFITPEIRVKVIRDLPDGYKLVQTCDLAVRPSMTVAIESEKLTPFEETLSAGYQHRDGLVSFW